MIAVKKWLGILTHHIRVPGFESWFCSQFHVRAYTSLGREQGMPICGPCHQHERSRLIPGSWFWLDPVLTIVGWEINLSFSNNMKQTNKNLATITKFHRDTTRGVQVNVVYVVECGSTE